MLVEQKGSVGKKKGDDIINPEEIERHNYWLWEKYGNGNLPVKPISLVSL